MASNSHSRKVKKKVTTSRRVVVKIGSGVLTGGGKETRIGLSEAIFNSIAAQVSQLIQNGDEVLIVSSGAVAAGLGPMNMKSRPSDIVAKQGVAALGQPLLMNAYQSAFAKFGLAPAQILLTHADIDSRVRSRRACNTLRYLLSLPHVVPIVNENDTVAVEELSFGDNDALSAEVAALLQADLLVLLTSVEGLLDSSGKLLRSLRSPAHGRIHLRNEKGELSVGGMSSKLDAVEIALAAGCDVVIGSGLKDGSLLRIASGKKEGTYFRSQQ